MKEIKVAVKAGRKLNIERSVEYNALLVAMLESLKKNRTHPYKKGAFDDLVNLANGFKKKFNTKDKKKILIKFEELFPTGNSDRKLVMAKRRIKMETSPSMTSVRLRKETKSELEKIKKRSPDKLEIISYDDVVMKLINSYNKKIKKKKS